MPGSVGLALLGPGNVGAGVVAALRRGAARYSTTVGRPLELRRVLVRDASKAREGVDASIVTTSFQLGHGRCQNGPVWRVR